MKGLSVTIAAFFTNDELILQTRVGDQPWEIIWRYAVRPPLTAILAAEAILQACSVDQLRIDHGE